MSLSAQHEAIEGRDELFEVETRGIDYIPKSERHGKPRDLLWLWLGVNATPFWIVYGAIIVSFGLSFWQSIVVVVVGNLSFIVVGWGSLSGPEAGTTGLTVTRAPFGIDGNRIAGLFAWMVIVGYEAVTLTVIVVAGIALAGHAGVHADDPVKIVAIVVGALLISILAIYGHKTILKVVGALSVPFMLVFVVGLAIYAVPKARVSSLHQHGSWQAISLAFTLVVVTGGIGFIQQAADYSRYLPKEASNRKGIVWSSFLGSYISSTSLAVLGVLVGTRLPTGADAVTGIPSLLPTWFAVVYLSVLLVQFVSADAFYLYSSGVTLQSMGVRIRRSRTVLVDTVVCCVVATFAIFKPSINTLLSDFVSFSGIFLAPFTAIYLIDWFFRKGKYGPDLLFGISVDGKRPPARIKPVALIALGLGMVSAALFINTTVFEGWLARPLNGPDLSWVAGLIVGGVVYYFGAASQIRREAAVQVDMDDALTPEVLTEMAREGGRLEHHLTIASTASDAVTPARTEDPVS